MMADTKIQWAERVWNPLAGCTIVSAGCRSCYAMKMAHRLQAMGTRGYEGTTKVVNGHPVWTGRINLIPEKLEDPLRWKKPVRIFLNSMSDLFHENVPNEFISQVFATMALCPQHQFLILTKRPERMQAYLTTMSADPDAYCFAWAREAFDGHSVSSEIWPLPNVWLGTSVEDQKTADERIPHLIQTPAFVHFISYEPAIGPIRFADVPTFNRVNLNLWNWLIIVGGESGAGARPFNLQWARDTIRQCKTAGVKCFVKQLGSNPYNGSPETRVSLKDSHGGKMEEWPEDLRVREMPAELLRSTDTLDF